MTYYNLYELFVFLKQYQITLTEQLKKFILAQQEISADEYPIFLHSLLVVKEYFAKRIPAIKSFLLYGDAVHSLSDSELIDYINLIAIQNTPEKQRQVSVACMVREIRENKESLYLIVSQDRPEKQREMRITCMLREIRENKEILYLIASQDTWEKQEQMRLDFMRNQISNSRLNNQEALLKCYLDNMDSYIAMVENVKTYIISSKLLNKQIKIDSIQE